MVYTWNPWHGCHKKSEGCLNCYMFYLDKIRNTLVDSSIVKRTKQFNLPLLRDRRGSYKIQSKDFVMVCMTSDFFIEDADSFRDEAWDIMRIRKDVVFSIFTKRPERIMKCLPSDWEDGYDNVIISVSCENQKRADERIPILLDALVKHRGIVCAPLIEEITLDNYLKTGLIEEVSVGGENYDGARVCDYDWILKIYNACVKYNVNFEFYETGMKFRKDGKLYYLKNKNIVKEMANLSGLKYKGKDICFDLYDEFRNKI